MTKPGSDNRFQIFSKDGAFKDENDPRLSEILSILTKDTLPGRFERAFPDNDPLLSQHERDALSEFRDSLTAEMGLAALDKIAGRSDRRTKPVYSFNFSDVRRGLAPNGLQSLGFEIRAAEIGMDVSSEGLSIGMANRDMNFPLRHYPIIPDLTSYFESSAQGPKSIKKLEPEMICEGGQISLIACLDEQEQSTELKRSVRVQLDARALKELLENAHWQIEAEIQDRPTYYFSLMRTLLEEKLLDRVAEPFRNYCVKNFGEGELATRMTAEFKKYLKRNGHTSIREISSSPAMGDEALGAYEVELLVAAPKLSEADFVSWIRGEPAKPDKRAGLSVASHVFAVGLDDFGAPRVKFLFSAPDSGAAGSRAV